MSDAAPQKIAVLFVHGIEIADPGYADHAIALLQRHLSRELRAAAVDADEAMAVVPGYWSDVVALGQKDLLYAVLGSEGGWFFDILRWLVTRLNAGVQSALIPFGAAAVARQLPGLSKLHYPALRWVITDFVGDAIAYQITPGERRLYDAIHTKLALALADLARRAGPNAPLCVIAHSLGSVIASNYFYDLQAESGQHDAERAPTGGKAKRPSLVPEPVRRVMGGTPLERGETLTHFYTLGSPIALWALRYEGFGTPIHVPSPQLDGHHPGLPGEWINFFDRDDLVAYPLRGLGPRYEAAVREDCDVRLRGLLVRWNPLVHPWYWNDSRVMAPIAAALARTWQYVNRPVDVSLRAAGS